MVERVEDMLLPNAVVQRIIKEALPAGINVGKEARETISRAASIFVLYLTSTARDQLQLRNQKTLTPADVTLALQKMEMENFVEPLQKAMEQHKRHQKNKKDRKQPTSKPSEAATETETIIDTEEQEDMAEISPEDPETETIIGSEDPVVDQSNVETEPMVFSEEPVVDTETIMGSQDPVVETMNE